MSRATARFGQRAHVVVGRLSFVSRGTPSQMDGIAFVAELEAFKDEHLAPITTAGEIALTQQGGDSEALLKVALANEISVSELAALWIPTTKELDVKLAFAKQAGDEARHFETVAERLAKVG